MSRILLLVIGAVIGAGIISVIWAVQPKPVNQVAVQTEEHRYEDGYLSFEYPEDMVILKDQVGEGRLMYMLDWLKPVEDKSYFQTIGMFNPQLDYPYNLSANDYQSWDDLKADKSALQLEDPLMTMTSFSVNGQDAILIDAGGFCEHHYTLFVQGPTGVVYSLTAGCLLDEEWNSLYGAFAKSVEFKQ